MSGGGWPAPGIVAIGEDGGSSGTSHSLTLPGPLVFEDTILAFIVMVGDFSGSEVDITGTGGQFWFERPGRTSSFSGTNDTAVGVWSHFITEADEAGMTTMDFTTDESIDNIAAVFYVLDSHVAGGSVQVDYDQGNGRQDVRYQGPHFYMNPGHGSFHVLTKQLTFAATWGNAYVSSYGPPTAAPPGWTFDGNSVHGTAELYIATKVGGDVGAPLSDDNPIEPVNYLEEVMVESSSEPGTFLPGYVDYFGGAVNPPLAGLDEFPGPFCAPGNGWTWDAWGDPDNCKNALGFIPPSPGQAGYGFAGATSYAAHYHEYHVDVEEDVPYWGMLCTPSTES